MRSRDDQVRELFVWVRSEEERGRTPEIIFDEIANHARRQWGLSAERHFDATGTKKVTFEGTSLVIRHDGEKWLLGEG